MAKHLNLISYFGGKYPHLKWLIDKFPAGNYHFVDIMCGSANVALNVNYPLVTINDINDEVINLFEVLRNHYDEFLRLIYFTPFSRNELNKIIDDNRNKIMKSNIERARRYFVLSQLGFGGNGSQNNHYGFGVDYKLYKTNYYKVDNWNIKLKRLAKIANRLRQFQIESKNALELFEKVNKKGNIVYWDPPYLLDLRKLNFNINTMSYTNDHKSTYRKVLEIGCNQMLKSEDMNKAQKIWDSFPVLHRNWVFVAIKNKVKNQLNATNN